MKKLENLNSILIKQKRAWGEILTGIEQKNKYHIFDDKDNDIYFAGETKIKLFWRLFLKGLRPFEIHIVDESNELQLVVSRPFRWFYHECSVFLPDGTLLGTTFWQFAILNRKYVIKDGQGNELFRLFGPLFRPWTFKIMKLDRQIGVISKKWSGLFREVFSDEDFFGLMLDEPASLQEKQILLGSVFLIDFINFERR